jgi:hypothetical protein
VAPPFRIANCSGFYGDRFSAPEEMVEGGPIDVLTGDYLAELTMLILWKDKQKDPALGYAKTFLKQAEEVLATCAQRGIKIVVNAGGLNPAGLATKVRELRDRLGVKASIAHNEGDNLLPRLKELQLAGHPLRNLDTGKPLAELKAPPLTANAYLGAWGVVEALKGGADVVLCPRVTDASLVVGPAAWKFGWGRTDWDRLASAVVAGHIVECGAQATGGNYAFFQEAGDLRHPGFPLVEMEPDGTFVVTKHPGTGGKVSIGTVTAQLLYEVSGPRYMNPDAVARFDTVRLEEVGPNRVRVSGVRGEPVPDETKVCINYLGGFRNSMTFVLTGLDIEAKADLVKRTLFESLGGEKRFASVDVQLIRSDKPDPPTNEEASALLRFTLKDPDPKKVGRAFSSAVMQMGLATYPGFYTTTPPTDESPYGVYWPALVPREVVREEVVFEGGSRRPVEQAGPGGRGAEIPLPAYSPPPAPDGPTRRVPLGTVVGARSGDKGGNANVGVWVRSDLEYGWLYRFLTVDKFKQLIAEARPLTVERYEFPNLRALNFVVKGLLGEGVASSTRMDPLAKSLGEYLRAKVVEVPVGLLASA